MSILKPLNYRLYRALSPQPTLLDDFSGGLNIKDWPYLQPNELAQALNVVIDGKRVRAWKGVSNSLGIPGKTIFGGWYSDTLQCDVVVCNDGRLYNLQTATILAGSPVVSATGKCWCVDFAGLLVVGSVGVGIYTCTAAGVWTLATNAIKPWMLAVWQGKVWAIGDPAFPQRLWASNVGNAGVWTNATDFVDIPEGGEQGLTSIIATQEEDIIGRPSLIVYKRFATIRINSSNATTGFTYSLLGAGMGCVGRRACATDQGRVLAFDDTGIWSTTGAAAPKLVSDRVSPIFGVQQQNITTPPSSPAVDAFVCAGARDGKFYFSCTFDGDVVCNMILCYDVATGGFTFLRPTFAGVPIDLRCMWMKRAIPNFQPVALFGVNGQSSDNRVFGIADEGNFGANDSMKWQTAFLPIHEGLRFNTRFARVEMRLPTGYLTAKVDALTDWSQTVKATGLIAGAAGTPAALGQYDVPGIPRGKSVSLAGTFVPQSGVQWRVTDDPSGPFPHTPYVVTPPMELERIMLYTSAAGR